MRICAFLLIATLAAADGPTTWAAPVDTPAPSVLVTTAPLRAGSLPRTVTAWGVMLSPPSATVVISAGASEIVGAVHVHVGEEVQAGAPLVDLKPDAQTAASYSVAQSALRDADAALTRTRALLAQHLATAQQLDAAQKSRTDAQATLQALKTQGAGGAIALKAPFHAIVTKVAVARGAQVSGGTALVELARAGDLSLRVQATPAQARQVHAGDAVAVRSLDGAQKVAGKVARNAVSIDAVTGLVPIDITLPANPLFAGESAEAVITVGSAQGYVVPHAAILLDPEGKTYVVQVEGGKARKVPVRIATNQGDRDLVQGVDLKADEPLVLEGNYQLDDGMAVRLADQGGAQAATVGAK